MKDGTASVILTVNAMNFGLLAEEEQDAVMYAYAGLLNSLNYPIQIIINSTTKDVTAYLHLLQDQEETAASDTMRRRIRQYREFVSNLIQERNVLDKKFYVAIPANSVELGLMGASTVLPGKTKLDISTVERSILIEKAQNLLEPKRDHLIAQFARIGLFSRQLNTQEIIQLFYMRYNPEAAEGQQIAESKSYTSPIVQASMQGSIMNDPINPTQPGATDQTNAAPQQQQPGVTIDSPAQDQTPTTPSATPNAYSQPTPPAATPEAPSAPQPMPGEATPNQTSPDQSASPTPAPTPAPTPEPTPGVTSPSAGTPVTPANLDAPDPTPAPMTPPAAPEATAPLTTPPTTESVGQNQTPTASEAPIAQPPVAPSTPDMGAESTSDDEQAAKVQADIDAAAKVATPGAGMPTQPPTTPQNPEGQSDNGSSTPPSIPSI